MPETNFFWDPLSDDILQERDEVGTMTAEYTTDSGRFGNVICQRGGGVENQLHFDAMGSTLAVTDASQSVTDSRSYSGFGETTESMGNGNAPTQYIGRRGYYRVASDYYVRRRYYNPLGERWLSVDPLGVETRGLTVFAYVQNRPTGFVDPSGLQQKPATVYLALVKPEFCPDEFSALFARDPVIAKCWEVFARHFGRNRLCSSLRVRCGDCDVTAIHTENEIMFCNAKCVKNKEAWRTLANTFCHELIHHMQSPNCWGARPSQTSDLCVNDILDEVEAYFCARDCSDVDLCMRMALGSIESSPRSCKPRPTTGQIQAARVYFEKAMKDVKKFCVFGITPDFFPEER